MIFRHEWCCQHSDIWDNTEEGPPCEVCPLYGQEIDDYNQFCYERWKYLDITGRDRGFGEMPLREEAIDQHLQRYGANDPDIYETIFRIEMVLFAFKQDEEKKRKDKEDRKRKAEQSAKRSASPSRSSAPRPPRSRRR